MFYLVKLLQLVQVLRHCWELSTYTSYYQNAQSYTVYLLPGSLYAVQMVCNPIPILVCSVHVRILAIIPCDIYNRNDI